MHIYLILRGIKEHRSLVKLYLLNTVNIRRSKKSHVSVFKPRLFSASYYAMNWAGK